MNKKEVSLSSLNEFFRPNIPKGLRARNLSSTRLDILKQEIKTDLHLRPLNNLFIVLETDPTLGLTNSKAEELLNYYGHNTLTPTTNQSWHRILFKSMCTGFSILIWTGAALCIIAFIIEVSTKPNCTKNNLYLGCVLIAVDVICGSYSFFQNYKSSQIMKTFNRMIPVYTKCIRAGVIQDNMPVSKLVKGDIVFISAGDIIPADIRIIDSKGFKVDNSSLTGESLAVSRSNTEGKGELLQSPNVAFFSTQCVEGWAKGVVICCGDLTAMGRVAGLAARLQPAPSPLSREISRLMRIMSMWAIFLGLIIAMSAAIIGYPVVQITIFVIGIIVANIPEGLQPTVTASLTLTAQGMVKRKCLVKNLDAIEALGACTTICSDKTGTLTKNEMRVFDIWLWNTVYDVAAQDFSSAMKNNQVFAALKLCGSLCSTTVISSNNSLQGDASEKAILTFIFNHDDPKKLRRRYPKVAEIPFNSSNKYQVSVHLDESMSRYIVMMKGAPEGILNRCTTIAFGKGNTNFTRDMKDTADKICETLASTGQRILAFADLPLDPNKFPLNYEFNGEEVNFPLDGLRFIGLIGLIDPPREEVSMAIQRVRAAGVRVIMVTGDHPVTAKAIAAKVGIATSDQCHVVTGDELRDMAPEWLDWTIDKYHEIVFARTSPTQKLKIVEAFQRRCGVVAVTGDGVNDAPALRRADIGISMGITGSQVSKQTADIILMDDNFATIVNGIEEGRKIFDNLKKSICYILISNVPEIIPVFMFIMLGIPLPLGVMTILCIDLGTDMWPAVSLAHEAAESDVMARPPRSGDRLVSGRMITVAFGHLGLIEVAAGMFAYFVIMATYGFNPSDLFGIRDRWDNEAVTDLMDSRGQEWTYMERKELERASQASYFVAVVCMQITNGVICKTQYNSLFHVGMKNQCLNIGILFEIILAIILCYVPAFNNFFYTYPLHWSWWFLSLPFCMLMFAFDEFRKYCIRTKKFNGWYNKLTYY